MAAEDSNPLGVGCGSVNQKVLNMLDSCSEPDGNIQGWKMKYVGRLVDYTKTSIRLLRSRERRQTPREEHQSERELTSCGYCCDSHLNAGERMACCLYGGNQHSYCGSPTGSRRLADTNKTVEEIGISETPLLLEEADMATITKQCTKDFKDLAKEYARAGYPKCIGSFNDVFCQTVQVVAA